MYCLPFSTEIEKSVLGCIILDSKLHDKLVQMNNEDFYNPNIKDIYNACLELYNSKSPIDLVTISDMIKDNDNVIETIVEMTDVATTSNFEYLFGKLKDYSVRRAIINKSIQIKDMALNNDKITAKELKSDAMMMLDINLYDSDNKQNKLETTFNNFLDHLKYVIKSDNTKSLTGFRDLDKLTAGLHPEELTIIAARPGGFKSAFAMQLMINYALKGNKSIIFSREMSQIQIMSRIVSNLSGINGQKIRFAKTLTKEELLLIKQTYDQYKDLPIIIDDRAGAIEDIRIACRDEHQKAPLALIVVDYLQLCTTYKKSTTREQEISHIARQLKLLSSEFQCPVIALSQLNRLMERENRRPVLSDLRESGSIEQDANNVIFLYVDKESQDPTLNEFEIEIIIAKQRSGPNGLIKLKCNKTTSKFSNI